MNTCAKCGHSTADGETFCAECGTPLNGCRECGAPVADGTKFCSECGTPWGCKKCGQPIADGIKFCAECGASVLYTEPGPRAQAPELSVQAPETSAQASEPSTPIDFPSSRLADKSTVQPTSNVLETPNSNDILFATIERKKPINTRLIVISILAAIIFCVAMYFVAKSEKTQSQSSTLATAPVSNASTASQTVATPPATQLTQQPANTQPDNEDCAPTQPDASSASSTSLLDAIDGKKLKVGSLSCDLNGGTYSLESDKFSGPFSLDFA
jgi:type II secretory pathway pseudopilin PulG